MTTKDLKEDDWNHIFNLISEGFTSGEICCFQEDETQMYGWWQMTATAINIT